MLLNEMDFKLNLFAPKVSSYFGVKLDQKLVNLFFFCIFNLIMKIIKLNSFSIFNLIM